MPPEGLSMADLTQKAQVSTLRRNEKPGNEDPLEEASKITRRVVADSMIARTVNQTNADSARAEAETAKAKTDAALAQAQYEEILERKRQGSSNEQFQEFVMGQLKATQDELAAARDAINQRDMAMLQDRITILQSQLESITQGHREIVSPITAVRNTIEEYQAIKGIFVPEAKESPAENPPNSPMVEAWLEKAKLEHEYKRLIHTDEHEARMEELKVQREVGLAEVAVKERTAEQITRGVTDTLPKVLDLLKELSNAWLGGGRAKGGNGVSTTPASASAGDSVRPHIVAQPPEGFVVDPCPDCGWPVYYQEAWENTVCSNCGKVLNISPNPTAGGTAPKQTSTTPGIAQDEEQ